jgi:hypothetical protein
MIKGCDVRIRHITVFDHFQIVRTWTRTGTVAFSEPAPSDPIAFHWPSLAQRNSQFGLARPALPHEYASALHLWILRENSAVGPRSTTAALKPKRTCTLVGHVRWRANGARRVDCSAHLLVTGLGEEAESPRFAKRILQCVFRPRRICFAFRGIQSSSPGPCHQEGPGSSPNHHDFVQNTCTASYSFLNSPTSHTGSCPNPHQRTQINEAARILQGTYQT